MTAVWNKDAQKENFDSKHDDKNDAVNKYTAKMMESHEASQIFASPHSEWNGSADSAVNSVHSLLGSVEDTQTAIGVPSAWESHSWDGAPSPLSAQSIMSPGDANLSGSNASSGDMPLNISGNSENVNVNVGSASSTIPDTSSSAGSSSANTEASGITPGISTNAIMDQAAQTDPTLGQVLFDSQSQMSASGFSQYAQNVYQNWGTGAFPDDTSLLEASAYQLQQQGGSASDVSAAQSVAQTDLAASEDNAVSTYGSNGTNTIIQELAQTDPTLGQVLTDSQPLLSASGISQYAQDVYQNWTTGAFPDDASLLEAASYQLQQQGGSASDVSAAQSIAQIDLTNLGDNAVSTYGTTAGTSSGSDSGSDSGTSSGSGGGSDSGTSSGSGSGSDSGTSSGSGSGSDSGTSSGSGSGSDSGTSSGSGSGSDSGTSSGSGSGSDSGTSSGSGSGSDSGTSSGSGSGSDSGTSTGSGPGAAVGPNGEAVGSTATTFGVDAMPASAQSAPGYYVEAGASGDGTGTLGSQNNPFSTLQQAQQAMENSDIKTTYVEGGTYSMSSTLNLTSADSGESFIGVGGSSNPATLDGGGTLNDLVSINGANNVTMEGLALQNTSADPVWDSNTPSTAISVTDSSGDNFSYNSISNVGYAYINAGVSNTQFDGNDINNVQDGIFNWPGNTNNTIDSNRITNVSNVTGINSDNVGAIELAGATGTQVSNNVIENTAGGGINLENYGGNSPNNNSIVGNTLEDTNTAATPSSSYDASATNPSDMGAIYAWQGAGNASDNMNLTISNNYVQNAGAGFENVGIYLDDGVSGATVTGNVVQAGGSGWDMLVHGGSNDTLENNVLDLTSSTGNEKGVLMQSDGPQMTNDTISSNYFYSTGANGGAYTDYSQPSDNIPQTISNNTYWGVDQSSDSSPITGNPGFVDPSSGDYQLES